MYEEIVGLLRAKGEVRHLDAAAIASVRAFFAKRVRANLVSAARRHPLGFLFVTESLGGGLTLRYHIWPAGWCVPRGQESGKTHDHSYELNSLVVAGSLRQRTFHVVPDLCGKYEVLEVNYKSECSALMRTGVRVHLTKETDEIFSVGTAYRLAPGAVHRVEAVTQPSATLVLSVTSRDAPAPRVFVPLDENAPGAFIRGPLNEAELATARKAVCSFVVSQGPPLSSLSPKDSET